MGANVSVPKDCAIINAEEEKETAERGGLMSGGFSSSGLKSIVSDV